MKMIISILFLVAFIFDSSSLRQGKELTMSIKMEDDKNLTIDIVNDSKEAIDFLWSYHSLYRGRSIGDEFSISLISFDNELGVDMIIHNIDNYPIFTYKYKVFKIKKEGGSVSFDIPLKHLKFLKGRSFFIIYQNHIDEYEVNKEVFTGKLVSNILSMP